MHRLLAKSTCGCKCTVCSSSIAERNSSTIAEYSPPTRPARPRTVKRLRPSPSRPSAPCAPTARRHSVRGRAPQQGGADRHRQRNRSPAGRAQGSTKARSIFAAARLGCTLNWTSGNSSNYSFSRPAKIMSSGAQHILQTVDDQSRSSCNSLAEKCERMSRLTRDSDRMATSLVLGWTSFARRATRLPRRKSRSGCCEFLAADLDGTAASGDHPAPQREAEIEVHRPCTRSGLPATRPRSARRQRRPAETDRRRSGRYR